jgi:hypothetical protein
MGFYQYCIAFVVGIAALKLVLLLPPGPLREVLGSSVWAYLVWLVLWGQYRTLRRIAHRD